MEVGLALRQPTLLRKQRHDTYARRVAHIGRADLSREDCRESAGLQFFTH